MGLDSGDDATKADAGDSPSGESFSVSESKALVPLLLAFVAIVLVIVAALLGGKSVEPPAGGTADHAYGPADFPAVFAKDESLSGLETTPVAGHGVPVPLPPLSEGIFPCSGCHADLKPDLTRRKVDFHEDIVLHHDEENRWCLDCHDPQNRDKLRLASGVLIDFTESYKLCGQCHGTQYRDWKVGIHGKRTGYWNGPKRYLLCVHCHSPHSPRFKSRQPLPPPIRPEWLAARPVTAAAPAGKKEAHAATTP